MHLTSLPGDGTFSLAIHGGAGPRKTPLTPEQEAGFSAGLKRALEAGRAVLSDGGTAVEAVSASVVALEDDELFNAGRGAALTTAGTAELDACIMDGRDRSAGAVVGSRFARNPIAAANAVRLETRHVLMADLPRDLVEAWGLDVVEPEYFVTQRRLDQLHGHVEADASTPHHGDHHSNTKPGSVIGHGTVGAVARDAAGHVAAATSTGGVTGQLAGRIGDAPIVGAGTFADDATIAISCTGIGEYFLRGVLSHDVAARMRYLGENADDAVRAAIEEHLTARGGDGGLVAVTPSGQVVLGFNSQAMFRGYVVGGGEAVVVA